VLLTKKRKRKKKRGEFKSLILRRWQQEKLNLSPLRPTFQTWQSWKEGWREQQTHFPTQSNTHSL